MDSLPDDALHRIAEMIASEVSSSSLAALDALSVTCHQWGRVLRAAQPYNFAAHTLGMPSTISEHALKLCRAVAMVRELDGDVGGNGDGLHVIDGRRGGSFIRDLLRRLEPVGLACTWCGDGMLPTTPFVIIWCDAADRPSTRLGSTYAGTMITWPCAAKRCTAPAALACMHCRKHGGMAAGTLIRCCLEQNATRSCTGQIIFAAPSTGVLQAYRRALIHARRQARYAHEACTGKWPQKTKEKSRLPSATAPAHLR